MRWFDSGLFYRLLPVPFLVAAVVVAMRFAVTRRHNTLPFVLALVLMLVGYAGLLVSVWPFAIPGALTLHEAAAPHASQLFTLVGALIILPIIIAYTTAGYWVFSGKVAAQDTLYH